MSGRVSDPNGGEDVEVAVIVKAAGLAIWPPFVIYYSVCDIDIDRLVVTGAADKRSP